MRTINNNTLVKLNRESTTLGNGLSVNTETNNRKDVVTGHVISTTLPEINNKDIYFPLYAASMITTKDGEVYIVNNDDIMAVDD